MAAKPQANKASYYNNPTVFSNPMPQGERAYVYSEMFADRQEGFVTLSGDIFTPSWTGLMKVSGFCRVKYPPERLQITIGNLYVADTDASVISFTATMPAQPVQISLRQYAEFNFMMCNLLFEAVK